MNQLISILLLICITACNSSVDNNSEIKDDVRSALLISTDDALRIVDIDNGKYVIVQLSTPSIYAQGHIPGAKQLWRPSYTSKNKEYGGLIPDKKQLEILLSGLCVDNETELLLYDNKGNVDALRFAWILELYGFTNYKIINGGLEAWRLSGYAISKDTIADCNGSDIKLNDSINNEIIAYLEEVKHAIKDPEYILIDTRERYEYEGKPFIKDNKVWHHKKGAFDRGTIPGSVHLNWSELVELNGDHRFKSYKDLNYNLERKNISKEKKIIVYCQSGSRSAHTYFVLKHILGYPYVKNYDGSWIEWSYMNKNGENNPLHQICKKDSFESLLAQLNEELIN